jgi:hypothetical protein
VMKALRIPTEGRVELVDADVTLEWLQHQVGGLIEAVRLDEVLTDHGRKLVEATVFVNEEGKNFALPVNAKATDLCALTIGGWAHDVIVGSVVVLGQFDDDGEETGVPDAVVRIARNWGWLRS